MYIITKRCVQLFQLNPYQQPSPYYYTTDILTREWTGIQTVRIPVRDEYIN